MQYPRLIVAAVFSKLGHCDNVRGMSQRRMIHDLRAIAVRINSAVSAADARLPTMVAEFDGVSHWR
jgi:hypothetical protein